MLPLISNVLPTTPAVPTQSAPANASLLLGATADASAASRQFLSNAVVATGAPAAYFPGTAPQRTATLQPGDRANRVAVPPPTGDYIELNPPPAPPANPARFSAPVTLGIPLTTQFTAQFLAQQPVGKLANPIDPFAATRDERSTAGAPRSKEPSFGNAKGTTAYGIAAARSARIDAVPEIEPAE